MIKPNVGGSLGRFILCSEAVLLLPVGTGNNRVAPYNNKHIRRGAGRGE